ncbi:hypothetical protein B5M47_01385 [candidate division CPR3 bacterium 4484_211]|uniref:Uncharacterized protein n=1 Tax=candidate division CPR3 bacterium 4484_211 TaxID=1968527 RepID=A0A1W9NYU8_UNCC3|nr:MAG: hypothetical protein B5M47_01385 [candidate division CPR3 bacterium 4484_211]
MLWWNLQEKYIRFRGGGASRSNLEVISRPHSGCGIIYSPVNLKAAASGAAGFRGLIGSTVIAADSFVKWKKRLLLVQGRQV